MQTTAISGKEMQTKSLVPRSKLTQTPSEVLAEYTFLVTNRLEIGQIMKLEATFERWRYADAIGCCASTIDRARREPWKLSNAEFVETVRVHLSFHPYSQIARLLEGLHGKQ